MMATVEDIMKKMKPFYEEQINKLTQELGTLHIGRANTALVEDIMVSYYGTETPLKKLAQITCPQPNLIVIQPWDKNALSDIELGIRNSNLNLSPVNDGRVVRLTLPPLTEERRQELVKIVHSKSEEVKVGLRNIRRQAWDQLQSLEKQGKITEDDKYRGQAELNKVIEDYNKKIDQLILAKESEIMKV